MSTVGKGIKKGSHVPRRHVMKACLVCAIGKRSCSEGMDFELVLLYPHGPQDVHVRDARD